MCLDIGSQAIAGSTRLLGAFLAEVALGSLLGSAFYHYQDDHEAARNYPQSNIAKLKVIYHYFVHSAQIRKERTEAGYYSPGVVKMVLAMLALNLSPTQFI